MHYTHEILVKMALHARGIFERFDEIVGGDAGFRRTGFIALIGSRDVEALKKNVAMQKSVGMDARVLMPDDLKKMEPRFELTPGESLFQSIFDGKDLSGWHISQVNHHGKTEGWKADKGVITGTQDKPGNGGILLTDRRYRNFEVSLEVNPDFGCDSGLFLRSTEKGEAYQVLLDYLDGGIIGGVYGEKLTGVKGFAANWQDWWRRGEWNHLRARIEGEVPHIQVWLNGVKITDWRDTENHLPGGAAEGMIAVQVHGGNRWIPGGKHRFRNIAVRDLP